MVCMAMRIDWKRSLIMTVVLIAILYFLRYVLEGDVYCIAAILVFALIFFAGNLLFRRR